MPIYTPCSDAGTQLLLSQQVIPVEAEVVGHVICNQASGLHCQNWHTATWPEHNSTGLPKKPNQMRGAPVPLLPEYSSPNGVVFPPGGFRLLQLFTCVSRATLGFTVGDVVHEDKHSYACPVLFY